MVGTSVSPSGCAFVVVACADDESMATACKKIGISPTAVPQMVRIDLAGVTKYDADQLLHGESSPQSAGTVDRITPLHVLHDSTRVWLCGCAGARVRVQVRMRVCVHGSC